MATILNVADAAAFLGNHPNKSAAVVKLQTTYRSGSALVGGLPKMTLSLSLGAQLANWLLVRGSSASAADRALLMVLKNCSSNDLSARNRRSLRAIETKRIRASLERLMIRGDFQ